MATGGRDETDEALAAMGLKREAGQEDTLTVWPENWQPLSVFISLSTQWRIAPTGRRYGLDYAAIQPTLRLLGVARAEWPGIFEALQIMEAAFLEASNG